LRVNQLSIGFPFQNGRTLWVQLEVPLHSLDVESRKGEVLREFAIPERVFAEQDGSVATADVSTFIDDVALVVDKVPTLVYDRALALPVLRLQEDEFAFWVSVQHAHDLVNVKPFA